MRSEERRVGKEGWVERLLQGVGSEVPAGAVTVAVFVKATVSYERAVPVTVKMTLLPAPEAMLTVAARLLPLPLAPDVTLAVPVVVEVQVMPVSLACIGCSDVCSVALLGPLLVTVIVYVTTVPGV